MGNNGSKVVRIGKDEAQDRSILDNPGSFPSNSEMRSRVHGEDCSDDEVIGALTKTLVSPVIQSTSGSIPVEEDIDLTDLETDGEDLFQPANMATKAISELADSGRLGMFDQPEKAAINSRRFQNSADNETISDREEARFFAGYQQGVVQDRLNYLAIEEEARLNRIDHAEFLKERGSRLKNIGRALAGASQFALTTLPRLVDVLLPNSWQVTPKMEILDGLRNSKKEALRAERKKYERDMRTIGSAYDSIGDYVKFYCPIEDLPHLDTGSEAAVDNFVVECKFEKDSVHYKAVRHSILRRMNERTQKYNIAVRDIYNDNAAEEVAQDLLKSSWVLRAREKVKGWFTGKKQGAKPEFHKDTLLSPAQDIFITYNLDQQAKIREEGQIPSNEEVTMVGRNVAPVQRLATEPASAAPLTEAGVTKSTGDAGGKKTKNGRPFLRWAMAGAAALATIVGLSDISDNKHSDKINGQRLNDTTGLTDKHGGAVHAPAPQEQPKSAAAETRAATPQTVAAQRHANIGRQMDNLAGERKHAGSVKAEHQTSPKAAKTVVLKARSDKYPHDTAADGKKVEQPQPATDYGDARRLTESERIAQMDLVEAKVSAYKRRLAEMEKSADLINSYRSTQTDISKVQQLPGLLDNVSKLMSGLQIVSDMKKVDAQINQIDLIIGEAEHTVKTVNEAATLIPQAQALNLLKQTQDLAGSPEASFTITYSGNTNGGKALVYNVNLKQVSQKLATIQGHLDNCHSIPLQQAALDRQDAQYWVGYLKFVNWNLQYNRAQISLH